MQVVLYIAATAKRSEKGSVITANVAVIIGRNVAEYAWSL